MNPSCVQYCTLICSKQTKQNHLSVAVELSIIQRQSIKRMQRLHLLSFYNKSYYSTIIFLLFIIYYLLLLLICKHIFVRSFVSKVPYPTSASTSFSLSRRRTVLCLSLICVFLFFYFNLFYLVFTFYIFCLFIYYASAAPSKFGIRERCFLAPILLME